MEEQCKLTVPIYFLDWGWFLKVIRTVQLIHILSCDAREGDAVSACPTTPQALP
jgi:hypothetical protein